MNNKNFLIAISIFVFGFIITGFCHLENNKNSNQYYRQGVFFFNQGKYQDAYYNFKQIKRFSKLFEVALLKQFQCAQRLEDKKTAQIKLRDLIRATKNDNILPYALYQEALLSEENKQNENQLIKKFRFINKKYPTSDFGIASGFKLANLIETKDPKNAYKQYIEYLKYAPIGKFSLKAANSLANYDKFLLIEDYETIANSYFQNQKYHDALKYYQKAKFSSNWDNIAKCYQKLNNKELEKTTILKGLNLETSQVEEKSISAQIDRLVLITKSNKLQTLQDLYTKYPNSYITPTVMFKLAQQSSSVRALKLYEALSNDYPNSIWSSNSLWEVFWKNYSLKRYKTCEALAKKHIALYPHTQDAPRVLYWYGKVLLYERKNQEAKNTFYKVINNYPLDFYSFLSARQLKMSKAKKFIIKKPIASFDINSLNKILFKDKILLFLAKNNDFETIEDLKINDEYIKSLCLYKKEQYTQAINIAKTEFENEKENNIEKNQKPDFVAYELKFIYPILFENIINPNAKALKQSPYLFLSLIREESHFNKYAKSQAGAVGLSQLLKSTAEFIEKKPISEQTLLNEEENIKIGLKYFNYLYEIYNSEYLAILAYNAGPGNINKWLKDSQTSEIDVFIENIPFLETKNYIKKILRSYWIYINIYSNKHN